MSKTYKKITRKEAISLYKLGVQFECAADGGDRYDRWYMESDGWGPHRLGRPGFPSAKGYLWRVAVE